MIERRRIDRVLLAWRKPDYVGKGDITADVKKAMAHPPAAVTTVLLVGSTPAAGSPRGHRCRSRDPRRVAVMGPVTSAACRTGGAVRLAVASGVREGTGNRCAVLRVDLAALPITPARPHPSRSPEVGPPHLPDAYLRYSTPAMSSRNAATCARSARRPAVVSEIQVVRRQACTPLRLCR